TCPHCRGGHFEDLFSNLNTGMQTEIQEEIISVDIERADPHDLLEQYLEAVLECDSPEEVEDVLTEFFDEIFLHAMKETYITEIESKFQALNLLKEGYIFEEEEDDE